MRALESFAGDGLANLGKLMVIALLLPRSEQKQALCVEVPPSDLELFQVHSVWAGDQFDDPVTRAYWSGMNHLNLQVALLPPGSRG